MPRDGTQDEDLQWLLWLAFGADSPGSMPKRLPNGGGKLEENSSMSGPRFRIAFMKLGSVILFVNDFARMREFYENVLGVKSANTKWTGQWALFHLDGAEFGLHAIPEAHAPGVEQPSPAAPRETAPVKFVFHVDSVPIECARLEKLGARMLRREWQKPEESCDAADPEGNVFQIAAREHWDSLSDTEQRAT
jgi:catechol 2,3-dioxygenase-like lactoylglutathione lyase family enzyme